jgi:CTP synthase (UTP-ammonia lyase)
MLDHCVSTDPDQETPPSGTAMLTSTFQSLELSNHPLYVAQFRPRFRSKCRHELPAILPLVALIAAGNTGIIKPR